jgi:hypothetical protein
MEWQRADERRGTIDGNDRSPDVDRVPGVPELERSRHDD